MRSPSLLDMNLHIVCPPTPEPLLERKCALTVMIKAPRPGQSKTRLTPPLRSEDAAELSRCFYQDTANLLAEVTALNAFGVQVAAYAPAGSESEFIGLVRPGTVMIPQRQVGFGERLFGVAEDLFSVGSAAVALIDSDSPTVPAACYLELLEVLRSDPGAVVLGPTDDGGYYVLGICRALPVLFEGIAWSTNQVFEQTLERIKSAGLRPHVLPRWHDVDDFASVRFLDRELRGELPHRLRGYPARRTKARLGVLAAQGWLDPGDAPTL
jgi:rSAM/selenodomain-associated transferase 1